MRNFIAVVKWTEGVLDKYQDFDTQSEAETHTAVHGGFVAPDPGGSTSYWVVDAEAQTVTNDQTGIARSSCCHRRSRQPNVARGTRGLDVAPVPG